MYGRKACQLVKELAGGEEGQFTPFNSGLFEQVVAECSQHHLELQSLIRKIQDEGLDVQTARNADHYGALIHHLSLVRNKRCLMAYTYNRAENLRSLVWKVGHGLPQEIEEKICHSEKEYFKKHSSALKSYMSQLLVDLTVDMVPPKILASK
uniref:GINS subunit domain-containing protein n=1 Tax=Lotus japonicus TaxID=34305 RepID=I3T682_LOTJA|nr:unknown [Lotus japonicus]